jgi:ParB family chromosome partitioning protein
MPIADDEAALTASPDEILHVPLDQIDPCVHQSREHFDEAEEIGLAESLKADGQLAAGLAQYDAGRGRYVLIIGERRLRALRRAELPTMALKVLRGNLTPGQMLAMNLAENIQRASLNPVERARAFRRLMQLESLTATEVAARMGVSNATVSNSLDLLDLSESLQARVAKGQLPATVAAHIARVDDDATRRELADQYGSGILDRAGVAARVKGLLDPKPRGGGPPRLSVRQKHAGLSLSVTGTAEKWTYDNLAAMLARIGKEARTLKDAGNFDAATLAAVLKAS